MSGETSVKGSNPAIAGTTRFGYTDNPNLVEEALKWRPAYSPADIEDQKKRVAELMVKVKELKEAHQALKESVAKMKTPQIPRI